jgi:hypothetical protein
MNKPGRIFLSLIACAFIATSLPVEAGKAKGGSQNNVRSQSQKNVNSNRNDNKNVNVNSNRNTNKNVNVNSNRNKNVNVDVDVDHRGGHNNGCCYNDHNDFHPVATVAAVAVTAAVIGSIVNANSMPPGCNTVMVNGYAYQQCGNTWYQPQMSGSSTTYIVVNPPR